VQFALVRNFAWQFAGKAKMGRSDVEPASHRLRPRGRVKGRINFDGWEMTRVKFQPTRFGQIPWIKDLTPIFKTPSAGPDPNFLLLI
jgi:hypothetical protein